MMGILKNHSQVFRNVQLNILKWVDDEHLECECVPMPMIQMGRNLECVYEADKHKTLDMLLRKLKSIPRKVQSDSCIYGGKLRYSQQGRGSWVYEPLPETKKLYLCPVTA